MIKKLLLLLEINMQTTLTPLKQKITKFPANLIKSIDAKFALLTQKKENSPNDYVKIFKHYISKKLLFIFFLLIILFSYFCYKYIQPKEITYKTLYQTDSVTYSGNMKLYDNKQDKNLIYKGVADKGLFSGYGELYKAKPTVYLNYKGDFKDNTYNGFGYLYNKDRITIYKGNFANGEFSGFGEEYDDKGTLKYKGDFKNGLYNGEGKIFYTSGIVANEGFFKDGLIEGDGKAYYPSGIIKYEGSFIHQLFQNNGVFYSENKKVVYTGEFKNNLYEGKGKLFNSNGEIIFEGEFAGGVATNGLLIPFEGYDKVYPQGKVIIYSTTDKKSLQYEGDYNKDVYEGKGKVYFEDGNNVLQYEGDFKDNLFDGVGTLYNINKATIYKGYFSTGQPKPENFIGKSDVEIKAALGEPDKLDAQPAIVLPNSVINPSITSNDLSTFNYSGLGLNLNLSKKNVLRVPEVTDITITSVVDVFKINVNMKKAKILEILGTPTQVLDSVDVLTQAKTTSLIYLKDNYLLSINFDFATSNIISIEISMSPFAGKGNLK